MKLAKRMMVVASLALIVGAVMASPAFAGTKWNVTGAYSGNIKGSLTLKKNGASAVTCTVSSTPIATLNETYAVIGTMNFDNFAKCSNGSSWGWGLESQVIPGAGGALNLEGFNSCCVAHGAPWSGEGIYQASGPVPFTNGSGATNSYLTFSETKIGTTTKSGATVTATGKLEVFRFGGLLTVSTF